MSKAAHIVDRLLEAGPDEVDPKDEMLRNEPEMEHWLERNGFELSIDLQWYHKREGDTHFNVRPPHRMENAYTLCVTNVPVYYKMTADQVKRRLIEFGVAEP
jgi:hypothetical protein